MSRRPPKPTPTHTHFPYTTLYQSDRPTKHALSKIGVALQFRAAAARHPLPAAGSCKAHVGEPRADIAEQQIDALADDRDQLRTRHPARLRTIVFRQRHDLDHLVIVPGAVGRSEEHTS